MLSKVRMATGAVALCAGLALAGMAEASEIYFANFLETPVDVLIDGRTVSSVKNGNWQEVPTATGSHVLSVRMSDGTSKTITASFNESEAAQAKGGSWWCVAVGKADASSPPVLLQMSQAQCKTFVEAGN